MNAFWWWLLKTGGSIALSAPVIWGGAYWISDYVSDKHARGLTVAVEGLHSSVSSLNETVTAINTNLSQQLIDLERQRADLAIEIAKEVQKLEGAQGIQGKDIEFLRDSIIRIEKTIVEINANTKVRLTVDGGKTFETYDAGEAIYKFPQSDAGDSYVIVPWSTYKFDPATGQIEVPMDKNRDLQ